MADYLRITESIADDDDDCGYYANYRISDKRFGQIKNFSYISMVAPSYVDFDEKQYHWKSDIDYRKNLTYIR